MTLGGTMDVIIPYWWMAKHRCTGIYDGTLHFNDWPDSCFHTLSPDWSITYDKNLLTEENVFTIGAICAQTSSLKQLLLVHYNQYLQIFGEAQSTHLPTSTKYDHTINLQPGTEPK